MKSTNLFFATILSTLSLFSCAKQENPDPDPSPIPVESVVIEPSSLEIFTGEKDTVRVTVLPENATDKSYKLRSTDPTLFTVKEDGVVSAIYPGSAYIIVTAGDGKSDTCAVTVSKSDIVYSKKLKLDPANKIIGIGSDFTFRLVRVPVRANDPVVWSSDDESVVTVDSTGKVVAKSVGETKIHVRAKNCEVEAEVSVCEEFRVVRVDVLNRIENTNDYFDDPEPVRVARGETAAMQFCLDAFAEISEISVSVDNFGGAGKMLLDPKVYWERQITCSRQWDAWAGGAADDEIFTDNDLYFDPLMPLDEWNPAPVKAGNRAVAWCEFDIPRDFVPGTYTGTFKFNFRFTDSEGVSQTREMKKDFEIQVYGATMPEKQTMNVIQWDGGDYSEMNGGVYPDFYAWPELQTVIVKFMNDYCQTAWRLRYAAKHNMSGACKADYTTDPPTFKYDFDKRNVGWPREFELYLANCTDLRQVHGLQVSTHAEDDGRDRLIIGAYYMNPDKLDEEGRPTLEYGYSFPYSDSKQDLLVQEGFSEYFRQLEKWLRSHEIGDGRTWFDLYVQTISDEPKDPLAADYTEIARLIKAGSPEMKITDAIETNKIDPRYLDYPCPTLKYIPQCRAQKGQEQWMYTCMSPQGNYANRFIRIPVIKTRLVHWCNYYYDAPNYLHWGLMYWMGARNDDPYGDVCGQFIGGDSYIIYPGYKKVFPSIRLCVMRDGIRDFDLLKLVEAKDPAKAKEFLGRIVKGEASYETDVVKFRECRREMLEYLGE